MDDTSTDPNVGNEDGNDQPDTTTSDLDERGQMEEDSANPNDNDSEEAIQSTSKNDTADAQNRRTSRDETTGSQDRKQSYDETTEHLKRRNTHDEKTKQPGTSTDDGKITSGETDTGKTSEKHNGLELITAIKSKDKALALKLEREGADVDFVDELHCTAIHYAAREGYDDLIAEIVSQGGNVKRFDCDGDTPLHKASRTGHDSTVAVLISFGANIDALNYNGVNPLECAVKRNHVKVIETLCMYGVDLVMQDDAWKRIIAAKDSKVKKDQELIDILKRHRVRSAGYKLGGIKYGVKYIEKGKHTSLGDIDVSIQGKEVPIIFYCCKLSAEYSSITKYVNSKQEPFGDVYECRKWGGPQKIFTLTIKLKGALKSNETAEIASPDGKIGRVDDTTQSEHETKGGTIHYTEFKITITLRPNVTTTFMFVKVNKPEAYAISADAVKIQPKIEPEAEIDIPKGAFDKPGDLLLNVVETKDVEKTDEDKSGTDAVLLTNVINISMSNHQQPKQPIDMSLPLHFNLEEDTGVAILTSSKEFPQKLEDWEIFECIQDSRRKLARFKIPHFSICMAVSKKKLENDMLAVTKLVQAALKHERQVEFFVMAQTLSEKEYAVVIECALLRKAKKRKRHWRNKKYKAQDPESFSQIVRINSWFRIMFEGNIKQMNAGPSDTHKLMFEDSRENFRIFSVEVIDPKDIPMGRMKIELLEEVEQEPIEVVEGGCFGAKVTKKPQEPIQAYSDLTILPVHLIPHVREQLDTEVPVDLGEEFQYDESTIRALRWTSLYELTKRLDMDCIRYLAVQLKNYKPQELDELEAEHQSVATFLMHILKDWRGKRPYFAQVEVLARALDKALKSAEAEELRQAHAADREMSLF